MIKTPFLQNLPVGSLSLSRANPHRPIFNFDYDSGNYLDCSGYSNSPYPVSGFDRCYRNTVYDL